MDGEQERARRLVMAQADAERLCAEVRRLGPVAVGETERAVSDGIRDLAHELFGVDR